MKAPAEAAAPAPAEAAAAPAEAAPAAAPAEAAEATTIAPGFERFLNCQKCNDPTCITTIQNKCGVLETKVAPIARTLFCYSFEGARCLKRGCLPFEGNFSHLHEMAEQFEHTKPNDTCQFFRESEMMCPCCLRNLVDDDNDDDAKQVGDDDILYFIHLPCLHMVCVECFRHLSSKCPQCSKPLVPEQQQLSAPQANRTQTVQPPMSKPLHCLESLNCCRTSSVDMLESAIGGLARNPVAVRDDFSKMMGDFCKNRLPEKKPPGTTPICSDGDILLTCATDFSRHMFNDLVCALFSRQNVSHDLQALLNFTEKKYQAEEGKEFGIESIEHSGDAFTSDESLLLHGVHLKLEDGFCCEIIPMDRPSEDLPNLSSDLSQEVTREAVTSELKASLQDPRVAEVLADENVTAVFCGAQVVYKPLPGDTLRELSPKMEPSCVVMSSCKNKIENRFFPWSNDETKLTTWCVVVVKMTPRHLLKKFCERHCIVVETTK